MRHPIIFLLCCLSALPAARAAEITLHVRQHAIHAEIAGTPAARMRGLMQRNALCGACGMLFVYPAAGRPRFWMKDTPLPLSIAFIAPDGRIVNIAEMQPGSTELHDPAADVQYALEMHRGWFAQHAIRPGEKVLGLAAAPAARQ